VELLEERCLLSVLPIYYSVDGSGNNLSQPTLGSAGTDLLRVTGTAYGDGISSMAGASRPNPRQISNVLATQIVDPEPNSRNMSDMIYAWGQFIDHDLDLTPQGTSEYIPITIPADDTVFTPGSQMPVFRAEYDPKTGTSVSNPREQPNYVTSFLDGSVIYGSDTATANALRTFVGGQLKTSAGNLLPFNTEGLPIENDTKQLPDTQLYLGGDIRANENSELTSLDVLFVREHNYWATQLAKQHPAWTDEQLYQGARQIVIAELQNITFNEFLPALFGPNVLTPYSGYKPNANPSIAAEFSVAAYRMGHSLVNGNIDFFNNDGSESHDPVDFNVSADNPSLLQQGGASVDNILKYLVADNAQEVDNHVEDGLRNQLFAPADASQGGLDLYAIDIQRGRDLGLPDYNTVRADYGLAPVTRFDQITSDASLQAQLRQLYGTTNGQDNVNSIDLFVGGLSEDHVPGGSLGPTFTRIIADQFERLRDGDRLWYPQIFSGSDLQAIEQTTLNDVIARNTSMPNLQPDAFFFTTGTISGRVLRDANQNGTRDPGEVGAAGVTVMLLDSNNKLVTTTTSTADGSYQFDTAQFDPDDVGANPVSYKVVVVPRGAGDRVTTAALQTVDLVANSGAAQFGVDFGLATLSTVSFASAAQSANEDSGTFSLTVNLSTPSAVPIAVPFTVGGTAVNGIDYSGATTSPLIIAAGQASGIITGTLIKGNKAHWVSKTLTFTLGAPTNAVLGTLTTDTLAIQPALPAPKIGNVSLLEGTGGLTPFTFRVSLPALPTSPVTYNLYTTDGTAHAGKNYVGITPGVTTPYAMGTVTFAAGQVMQTITVYVIAGSIPVTAATAMETFTVNLSDPSNPGVALSSATGTIIAQTPHALAKSDMAALNALFAELGSKKSQES
jgi:hypothetical protein